MADEESRPTHGPAHPADFARGAWIDNHVPLDPAMQLATFDGVPADGSSRGTVVEGPRSS